MIAETLSRAADLIEPQGKWTQKTEARDEHGEPIDACDAKAVCFCFLGACDRVSKGLPPPSLLGFIRYELGQHASHFNDARGRTQAEVVSTMRALAARAADRGL